MTKLLKTRGWLFLLTLCHLPFSCDDSPDINTEDLRASCHPPCTVESCGQSHSLHWQSHDRSHTSTALLLQLLSSCDSLRAFAPDFLSNRWWCCSRVWVLHSRIPTPKAVLGAVFLHFVLRIPCAYLFVCVASTTHCSGKFCPVCIHRWTYTRSTFVSLNH